MIVDPEAKQGIPRLRSTRLKITVFIVTVLFFAIFWFQPGYIKGDIIRLQLDGCNYVLEADDGEKYELVDYDGGEKNNVKALFIRVDGGSICMVGPMIRIISII
ncbi:MAG: hypothetical protein ACXAD7_05315 [Candidatus Kariarchaeaceae archaeon]|jgi:hypothetical protein